MKKCLECGKETNNKKFCSVICSCRYKAKISHKRAIKKYYENPNYCLECGKIIKVKKKERPAGTRRRKFCSRSCSAIYNNKNKIKKRFCLNCGKEINSKKYCNSSCQSKYQNKKYIERWLEGKENGISGNSISGRIRNFMLKEANYKCSKCGWNEKNLITGNIPLHIHHIDGNYKNNAYENLRVLCPNCHSLTSTFGALNYGNSKRR